MRKLLPVIIIIAWFFPEVRSQNVTVEVDGDNLYYFESGCADCNGSPDPRWRARAYVGSSGPYDWNHDHDEVCNWCGHTNYSWVNPITKAITDNINIQLNGWESDGGICGGDDFDCGGYSSLFTSAIGIEDPCGWRYTTNGRWCGGGNYQIYWSYYWVYAQAPAIITQPVANTSACIGTPVTLTVAVDNDAFGRSMGRFYQWQRSVNTDCSGASGWANIAGATSSSYTVLQTSGTRLYRCLITSNCSADFTSNTVTSNCARVTYHPMNGSGGGDNPPAIQSSICGQTVLPGSSHILNTLQPPSVGAVANLTGYSWTASGGSLSSSTGSSTTWTAPATQGVYSITVTYQNSTCGNYTSVCNVTVVQPACDFMYVSPTGLDIISNGGPDNPFATLSYAVTQALANGKTYIRMLKGNYTETSIVSMFDNLVIEGGYVLSGSNWIKSSSTTAPAATSITFTGQEDANASSGHKAGIKADGVSGWTLQDINITTNAATGQTSGGRGRSNYGVWINNSSNYTITRCNITAGNASSGSSGTAGANGNTGQTGSNGVAGDIDSQCSGGHGGKGGNGATNGSNGGPGGPQTNLCCTCGTPGGSNGSSSTNYRGGGGGGSGGPGGSEDRSGGAGGRGREGGAGAALNPNGAAGGGGSGGCGSNCGGRSGANGAAGPNGASGSPNYTAGDLTGAPAVSYGSYFVPAGQSNNGGDGQGGTGGNGGGGGAGQGGGFCTDGSGSGGGGGGGGGEGGAAGTGAFGGGGSFGIYRNNSNTGATFTDIVVSSGSFGNGGSGGSAGSAGGGGSGGTGPNPSGGCGETGKGGNGGAGGSGGAGGRGQDGRPGTNGQMYTVGTGFTSPSSSVPNPTTITINYNNNKGCINSEIEMTKAAGSWSLPGALSYVNDVNSSTSSYTNASSPAVVQSSATGAFDITANGGTYNDYLRITDGTRPLPTISVSPSNVCYGTSFTLSAGNLYGTTVEYDWRVFSGDANIPDGPGLTSQLASPSFSLTSPGTYNVRLRIKEICCGWSVPVYSSFTIAPDLLAGTVSSSQGICAGGDPALLSETAPASGGIGAISYSWEYQDNCSGSWIPIAGETSSTFDPPSGLLSDRCYRRVATNSCGTVYSNTITVTVNPLPTANAGSNQAICNGESVQIGAAAEPGNTYSWSPATNLDDPGISNPNANPSNTTIYTLTETISATGCSNSNSVTVIINPLPAANTGFNQAICTGQSTMLGSAPVGGNTYSWNPATDLDDSTLSNPLTSAAATITYTLVETNTSTGCADSNSVTVTVNPVPAAVTGPDQTICENSGIQIGTVPVGGNTYSWAPSTGLSLASASDPTASPTTTTTYVLTETISATGCQKSDSMVVNVNPAPTANTGPDQTICNGQNIQIGAAPAGGNTYSWSPATALDDSSLSDPNANPSSTITYILTETITATGCQKSDSAIITVNALPAANTGFDQAICTGQNAMLGSAPVGGNTYSWNPATDLDDSTVSSPVTSATSTITYTLVETNTSTGCTDSNSVTVTVNPLPAAVTGTDQTICENSGIQIGAIPVGGNTYNWIPSTGLSLASASDPTASPITTTTYVLTEIISATGCQKSDSVTVNVNPAPAALAGPNQTICNGQDAQIGGAAVGGNTYSWVPPTNLDDATLSDPTANPSNTTVFTLTETILATGCQKSDSVTVFVNQLPVVTFSGLDSSYCIDASPATLNGTPVSGTFSGIGISGSIFDPAAAGIGTYNITYVYTDGNNCTDSSIQATTVNDLPVVTYSGFNGPYCASITTPIPLTGNPSGGTFTGPGMSGNDFYPNIANVGNNIVVYNYTDGNSCSSNYTDSVTVTGVPFAGFAGLDSSYCVDDSNAVILTGTPSGGTFSGNGVSGNSFTPSDAGAGNQTITYTFTDGNGCTNSQNQNATVFDLPAIIFSGLDTSYCVNGSDDALTGFPAGGTFSGTGITGNTFNPSVAGTGTHAVTYNYTDGNGCTNDTTINTTVYDAPVISFSGLASGYCINAPAANLTGNPTGGSFSGNGISGDSFYPSIAGAGTHTITYVYSDGNNCANTQTQDVNVYSLPVVSFSGLSGPYCSDASPVSLAGNPAGGTFSGPGISGNAFDPSAAGAGTHTIKYVYSDGNGCTDSSAQSIIVNQIPFVDFAGLDTAYCENSAAVVLNGFPSGGTFTGNGISGNSFDPSSPGTGNQTITYNYTDGNGCSNSISKNTVINSIPASAITPAGPTTFCQGNSVNLTADPAGASYLWSTNAIIQTITVSSSGNYFVTVTNSDNCSATATISVNANSNPVIAVSSVTDASCNGSSDGSASVSASGGAFPYSYLWDSNAGSQTSPAASSLGAGSYNVTVSDANNCSSSISVTVNNPSGLNAVASSVNTCTGGSIGTATANGSGGTSPYAYQWDSAAGNQSTATATGLAVGTYSVTVTDANSCTFVTSQAVNASIAVFISSSANSSCIGGSTGTATAVPNGGTSPYSYQWDNQAGNQNTATATGLSAGNYSITISDSNFCTASGNVNVTAVPAVTSSVSSSPSCNGGSTGLASVSASGGASPYSYLWDNAAGNQVSATATGLSSGNYSVTISDVNSCTQNTTVSVGSANNLFFTSGSTPACTGGSTGTATISPAGGTIPYSYQWDSGTGNQTSPTATALAPGNYSVTVTDANSCAATSSVSVGSVSGVSLSVSSNGGCTGGNSGTATVAASGGTSPYTYQWDSSTGNQATSTATGLSPGNYSVTVSDINGCYDTVTGSVTVPQILNTSATSSDAQCSGTNDGTASVTVNGGTSPYSYQWSDGQMAPTATGLSAGNYFVMITDAGSCIDTAFVTINQPPPLMLTGSSVAADCGASDGTATVNVAGGTIPYSYQWDANTASQASATATGLATGIYSVTVTDGNNCSNSLSVIVNGTSSLSLSITSTSVTCNGGDNGSAAVAASGGGTPYSYLWSSGDTLPVADSLVAGNYSVTVTNDDGCTAVDTISVSQPLPVTASISNDTTICSGDTISLTATGGNSYLWTSGQNTPSITVSPTASSTFSAGVFDNMGCMTTVSVNINVIPEVNAAISGDTSVCLGKSVTLTANGGTDYLWNTGENSTSISVSPVLSSVYSVTSSNSCFTDSSSALVSVSYIVASATDDTTLLIGSSAQLNASGGVLYLWEPPANLSCSNCPDPVASPLENTMYIVTVTDAGGCAGIDTVNITIDDSKAVFVPNIFSPNGDGENDVLYVFGKGIVKSELTIFNRWGEKVFESDNKNRGWDGVSSVGTPLNTGVFVYYLTVEFYDGSIQRMEGNITLVR